MVTLVPFVPWIAPLRSLQLPLLPLSRVLQTTRSVNAYHLFAHMTLVRREVVIEGSDDGVNYTQLISTPVTQATANYQDQEFAFKNSTPYLQYRITFDIPHSSTDMQIGEMQLFGVASDQPPSNDNCDAPRTLSPGAVAGTTLNATGSDITDCGMGDSADVWYSYTASASGTVEVNTCGSNSDTTSLIRRPSARPFMRWMAAGITRFLSAAVVAPVSAMTARTSAVTSSRDICCGR